MVSPQAKREAARQVMQAHPLGVTRACGLVGISRALFGYRAKRSGNDAVTARLIELAGQKRRYGYRRLHVLLRREGHRINRKRTYRLYRDCWLDGTSRNAKHRASRTAASAQADRCQPELVDGLRGRRLG